MLSYEGARASGNKAIPAFLDELRRSGFVGVDPAAGLIEMAKERFKAEQRASFHLGDAVRTEEPNASFDAVVAHPVNSHLADPEAALAEAYRVLKPGGQLVIFDGDYSLP
jgi:ubiquinone/menaquinone biosynthesis C-methylase UbiE